MGFVFVSDNLALDFAGTVICRTTQRLDLLQEPEALSSWAVAAGLTSGPVPVSRDGLTRAVRLREAVYELAVAALDGRKPARGLVDTINECAAVAPLAPALVELGSIRRREDVDAVLAAVARSAIDLFGTGQRELVSRCAGSDCTRLFVDRSRGRSRRWCGMSICGNQAKAAAYRKRQRVTGPALPLQPS